MYLYAIPVEEQVPMSFERHAALMGLTVDEAAMLLTGLSVSFISKWQTRTVPTAAEVQAELKTILTENPASEIYETMAMLSADNGGPDPSGEAHLEWYRAIVRTLAGPVVA
ncbi:hypothetical protein DP939_11935 [Spongiactinospora rosea]|uniref:Uncharacterized protein n=1 Tax=Spongiactinospora rosea TaxID=2248750 RepID=A0A366M360_9ACTN|nr:hypothetical protein [Spongiactinospora rosea]RBQ20477.1 hypothetical protein DP939_11935 [Spongiactinospora rosea]